MLRHFPDGRTARHRSSFVAALSASLLAALLAAPAPAQADDDDVLTHQKAELEQRIATSHADLDEVSEQLIEARGRLRSTVADLGAARARQAQLQGDVQAAAEREQQLEVAVSTALDRLADARHDLARGARTVADRRSQLAGFAVMDATSHVTRPSTLGLVVTAGSTHAAIGAVQGADSALDRQLADLQRLQAEQVLLRYTAQRVEKAAASVRAERDAAAVNLARQQRLEADAAAAAGAVAQQVADLQQQRRTLASARAEELRRVETMERERDRVEARLEAIAERRAAAHRAELARAAAAAAAERRANAAGDSETAAGVDSPPVAPTDTAALSWPVTNTYVTSPYGMRLHPILHIWELHDGTDFHAVCGTAVYAAAAGRVTSEYFNTGYGNRIIIDHGFVDGVSLWTSYNHLTSFVVSAGQQVSRGQLIAYSGTTGYSTGCHLHFMVYVDGSTVDPMTWL